MFLRFFIYGVLLFFVSIWVSAEPADVQVCFTPGGACDKLIVKEIYSAKQSIRVQSYSFTSYKIAHALVQMKRKGVDVAVIMDKSQFQCGMYSMRAYLIKRGVPIWEDERLNIAHNKVIIIDGRRVETGSYNFTKSAEHYNAENVVIIQSTNIARRYLANWVRRKSVSRRVTTLACQKMKTDL